MQGRSQRLGWASLKGLKRREKLMSETSRTKPRFGRGGDNEDGQALVEYALILALIMVVSIGALTALGTSIVGFLGLIESELGSIVAGS